MDWDKNGTISCIEFKSYLAKLKKGEELDHAECVEAFNAIDVDGSKQINWNEFFVSGLTSVRHSKVEKVLKLTPEKKL